MREAFPEAARYAFASFVALGTRKGVRF